jgi:hypothetical protein
LEQCYSTSSAASGRQTKSGTRQPGHVPSTSAPARAHLGPILHSAFTRAPDCRRRAVPCSDRALALVCCSPYPLTSHREKHSTASPFSFPSHYRSAHRAAPTPPRIASPPLRRDSQHQELKQSGHPSPGSMTPPTVFPPHVGPSHRQTPSHARSLQCRSSAPSSSAMPRCRWPPSPCVLHHRRADAPSPRRVDDRCAPTSFPKPPFIIVRTSSGHSRVGP